MTTSLFNSLVDLFFPGSCESCEKTLEGAYPICRDCENELPILKPPFCDICGEHFFSQSELSFQCSNCRGQEFHFDFALSALTFTSQSAQLVHRLKYERKIHVARILGKQLSRLLEDQRLESITPENTVLCPVPIHAKRERKRGFNQAYEIAHFFAKEHGFTLSELLHRTKHTEQQAHLNRTQRLKNLKNSFSVDLSALNKLNPAVKTIFLIDDVFTTGSTAEECSRLLIQNGIKQVIVLTVLRG